MKRRTSRLVTIAIVVLVLDTVLRVAMLIDEVMS